MIVSFVGFEAGLGHVSDTEMSDNIQLTQNDPVAKKSTENIDDTDTDGGIRQALLPLDPNITKHRDLCKSKPNKQKTQRYNRPKAKPTTEGIHICLICLHFTFLVMWSKIVL